MELVILSLDKIMTGIDWVNLHNITPSRSLGGNLCNALLRMPSVRNQKLLFVFTAVMKLREVGI
jgi:hypothetical protein